MVLSFFIRKMEILKHFSLIVCFIKQVRQLKLDGIAKTEGLLENSTMTSL
jgi:hypothetical protein